MTRNLSLSEFLWFLIFQFYKHVLSLVGWKKSKTDEGNHGFFGTEGNRGQVFLDLGITHP